MLLLPLLCGRCQHSNMHLACGAVFRSVLPGAVRDKTGFWRGRAAFVYAVPTFWHADTPKVT